MLAGPADHHPVHSQLQFRVRQGGGAVAPTPKPLVYLRNAGLGHVHAHDPDLSDSIAPSSRSLGDRQRSRVMLYVFLLLPSSLFDALDQLTFVNEGVVTPRSLKPR